MDEPTIPEPLPEEVPEERRGRHRMWLWFLAGLLAIALIVVFLRPRQDRSHDPSVPPGADTTAVQ